MVTFSFLPFAVNVTLNLSLVIDCFTQNSKTIVCLTVFKSSPLEKGFFIACSQYSLMGPFMGNINAYSTPEVMRIKDMITQGEFF